MTDQKAFDWQIQDVLYQGRTCQQFSVCKDDANYTGYNGASRAEIVIPVTDDLGRNDKGVFSVCIPDRKGLQNAVILQWHDRNKDKELPGYMVCPFVLQAFDIHPDFPYPHIRMIRSAGGKKYDWKGAAHKGFVTDVWQDFHFDILWTDKDNGYIKVWQMRDDEEIMLFEYSDPTCYNRSPTFKRGLYHPSWTDGMYQDKLYSALIVKK